MIKLLKKSCLTHCEAVTASHEGLRARAPPAKGERERLGSRRVAAFFGSPAYPALRSRMCAFFGVRFSFSMFSNFFNLIFCSTSKRMLTKIPLKKIGKKYQTHILDLTGQGRRKPQKAATLHAPSRSTTPFAGRDAHGGLHARP